LGLHYIYLGNVFAGNKTICKECGQVLIRRDGYTTRMSGMDNKGQCLNCGTAVDGFF